MPTHELHPHEREHFATLAPGETMVIVRAIVCSEGEPFNLSDFKGYHVLDDGSIDAWWGDSKLNGRVRFHPPLRPGQRYGVGEEWVIGGPKSGIGTRYVLYRRDSDGSDTFVDWQPASTLPDWAARDHFTVVKVEGKSLRQVPLGVFEKITPSNWDVGVLINFERWWNHHNPDMPFESNPWAWVCEIRKEGE